MSADERIGRRRFLVTGAGLVALAAAGHAEAQQAPAVKKPVTVRFAGQRFSAEMGRVIGARKGFDREFGVEWEFLMFKAGSEVSTALISGQVDLGGLGSFPSIALGATDPPVKVAWAYCYGGNRTALVARKGVEIGSVNDLVGKKVGARVGTLEHGMLLIALRRAGIPLDKVQVINMSAEDTAAALASGLIDAAAGTEPSNSLWVEKDLGKVVFRGGQYMAAYAFGHIADSFMQKQPDAAYASVLAFTKALWWARHHEDEAADILAKEFNQDRKVLAASMNWLIYDPRLKPLAKQSEMEAAEVLVGSGRIRGVPKFDHYHHAQMIARAQKEHPELCSDLPAYLKRKGVPPEQI